MSYRAFSIPYYQRALACDWCGPSVPDPLLVLHGAGNSSRERFRPLRDHFLRDGISSLALDFIGHGETGGDLSESSLESRVEQAGALISAEAVRVPLRIFGSSMGAYTAIKLAEDLGASTLILSVPGVYATAAYHVPFGPQFTEAIRERWQETDAFDILSRYRGSLLILGAENDEVIPRAIPQRLFDCARRAKRREIYCVSGCDHGLILRLGNDERERKIIGDKIVDFVK